MENFTGYPKFILNVENGQAFMTAKAANGILGSKDNFYRLVCDEGWFLPALKTRAITNDYLLRVIRNQVFRVQKNQVLTPPPEKKVWSKLDLLAFIQAQVGVGRDIGLTPEKMPDRQWLLTIAYSFSQDLEVFTGVRLDEEIISIPTTFLEKLAFFDPYSRMSSRNIFKKSSTRRLQEESKKVEQRISKKNRRRELLNQMVGRIDSQVDLLRGNHAMAEEDQDI